jgi:Leucine-rich repeat (LRR) protein
MLKATLEVTIFLQLVAAVASCPVGFSCTTETEINCTRAELKTVPDNLSENARNIIISLNNISFVNSTQFKKLKNLKSLIMSYNAIENIDPSVFHFTNKLTVLDLSYNKIECIKRSALTWLTDLRTLSVKPNRISSVDARLFRNNTNLTILDLSDNFIQTINTRIFESNCHLFCVNLEGNPLIFPSDWNLLLKLSLNTLEVARIDTNYVMVSLLSIQRLKELMHNGGDNCVEVLRFVSYENVTFLNEKERTALRNILLNKLN